MQTAEIKFLEMEMKKNDVKRMFMYLCCYGKRLALFHGVRPLGLP